MQKILVRVAALLLLTTLAAADPQPTTQPSPHDQARIASTKILLKSVAIAIDAFVLDTGRLPTTEEGLAALLTAPKDTKEWRGPYIESPIQDAWKHPFVYLCPGTINKTLYDLSSPGLDGIPGNTDDITYEIPKPTH